MQRLLLAVLLLALPVTSALAAPPLQEVIGVSPGVRTWSGVVVMTGDVLVPAGARLVIEAGTEVRVVPAEATKIDPEYLSSQTELLIRGELEVRGTAEAPVRFVIAEPYNEEIAWSGITLDGAEPSLLRHVMIERADIGIRCVRSAPLIEQCTLQRCRYGIVAQQQSHPKILDNRIADGEGGIFCWRGSNPYLKGNVITGNDEEGVFVDADSRPWLDRNVITANAIGLALYSRDLPYDDSAVRDNVEDLRWLGRQGQDGARP